jgi:hypothetical protein
LLALASSFVLVTKTTMTVSSRSDTSPTVPATEATQDTKMASTEESTEGQAASEGTDSLSPENKTDQHDDEPTTSNDRIPEDQHVSRDSEHVEDSSDDDDDDSDDEEDGKASSSDESPTSVADGIPDGDSNADLHALLAFSKQRLDTVKPVPDESQQDNNTKANDEEEDDEDDAQNKAEEEQQEEKKEEEVNDGDKTKETNDVAAAEKTAQDVPDETLAADDNDGSNAAAADADTADASKAKADDEATAAAKMDGMSSKEAAAKASQAGEDSNKELWALLSYSKQRLETGAHAGQKKDKKKSGSSRKKRSSSIGTSGSMKSPLTSPTASPARRPRKSDAAADTDMEELQLDGGDNTTGDVEDDDGQHSRESVASETLRAKDADGSNDERMDDYDDKEEYTNDEDEEEMSSDEENSEAGSSDEEEESDDDSTGGVPATPAFLRQLEKTDTEDPDSTDAKLMSDAARSYADAILSVADEKTTGDLTDEQMLEAMCVAEAAAAAGEERFTTSIAQLRLHEAKEASMKMAASMKAEVEKAAKTAKAAKDRQVARQNKFFSGKRPAGQWIKGKMKEFQETCAKVDGGQP